MIDSFYVIFNVLCGIINIFLLMLYGSYQLFFFENKNKIKFFLFFVLLLNFFIYSNY